MTQPTNNVFFLNFSKTIEPILPLKCLTVASESGTCESNIFNIQTEEINKEKNQISDVIIENGLTQKGKLKCLPSLFYFCT